MTGQHYWTWRVALRRAAEIVRTDGVKDLWFKVLGETVYRRMFLFEYALDAPVFIEPRVSIDVTPLEPHEHGEYLAFRPQADAARIKNRLNAGQRCLVARHDGAMAAVAWAATSRAFVDYLGCEIKLQPLDVYYYELYIAPAFRTQRVWGALRTSVVLHFHAAGHTRILVAQMPENRRMVGVIKAGRGRRCGTIGYFTAFGWRRYFARGRGAPVISLGKSEL